MIDDVLRAENLMHLLLVKLEPLIEEDIGLRPFSFIYGCENWHYVDREEHLPSEFALRKRTAVMERRAWEIEGRRFKTIRDDLFNLAIDLCNGLGTTRAKRPYQCLAKAEKALERVRCKLDDLLSEQHRAWEGFPGVFYGGSDYERAEFLPDGRIVVNPKEDAS